MRTPYVPSFEGVDIALVGIPFDGGTTNRPGARHGPREIRNSSSLMRSIHHVTRVNPYELCRVADVGDVPLDRVFEVDMVMDDITAYYQRLHAAGAVPLTAGGDHSITFPIFRAIA
ncbi:MAG: agmatinase, partial [Rhodospirillaceae bacterium]|nr:agmatinase [Rhodospirillaceae bacterium]